MKDVGSPFLSSFAFIKIKVILQEKTFYVNKSNGVKIGLVPSGSQINAV